MSTPLAWSEVTVRLDPARFTIRTVPDLTRQRADPMLALLDTSVDIPAVRGALAGGLKG